MEGFDMRTACGIILAVLLAGCGGTPPNTVREGFDEMATLTSPGSITYDYDDDWRVHGETVIGAERNIDSDSGGLDLLTPAAFALNDAGTVYIDPIDGDDANTGMFPSGMVKTFPRAIDVARTNARQTIHFWTDPGNIPYDGGVVVQELNEDDEGLGMFPNQIVQVHPGMYVKISLTRTNIITATGGFQLQGLHVTHDGTLATGGSGLPRACFRGSAGAFVEKYKWATIRHPWFGTESGSVKDIDDSIFEMIEGTLDVAALGAGGSGPIYLYHLSFIDFEGADNTYGHTINNSLVVRSGQLLLQNDDRFRLGSVSAFQPFRDAYDPAQTRTTAASTFIGDSTIYGFDHVARLASGDYFKETITISNSILVTNERSFELSAGNIEDDLLKRGLIQAGSTHFISPDVMNNASGGQSPEIGAWSQVPENLDPMFIDPANMDFRLHHVGRDLVADGIIIPEQSKSVRIPRSRYTSPAVDSYATMFGFSTHTYSPSGCYNDTFKYYGEINIRELVFRAGTGYQKLSYNAERANFRKLKTIQGAFTGSWDNSDWELKLELASTAWTGTDHSMRLADALRSQGKPKRYYPYGRSQGVFEAVTGTVPERTATGVAVMFADDIFAPGVGDIERAGGPFLEVDGIEITLDIPGDIPVQVPVNIFKGWVARLTYEKVLSVGPTVTETRIAYYEITEVVESSASTVKFRLGRQIQGQENLSMVVDYGYDSLQGYTSFKIDPLYFPCEIADAGVESVSEMASERDNDYLPFYKRTTDDNSAELHSRIITLIGTRERALPTDTEILP